MHELKDKKQSYSDKLKSPQWQRKRLEIFSRDNWTCKWCGNDKDHLHVHHVRYLSNREPWEYDDDNLVTLCDKCHENAHYPFIITTGYNNDYKVLIHLKNNVNLNNPEHLKDFIIGLQKIWNLKVNRDRCDLYLMRDKLDQIVEYNLDHTNVLYDLSYSNNDSEEDDRLLNAFLRTATNKQYDGTGL